MAFSGSGALPEAVVWQDLLLAQYLRRRARPYLGAPPLRALFLPSPRPTDRTELSSWALAAYIPPITAVSVMSFVVEWLAGLDPYPSPVPCLGEHRAAQMEQACPYPLSQPGSVGPADSAQADRDYRMTTSSEGKNFGPAVPQGLKP